MSDEGQRQGAPQIKKAECPQCGGLRNCDVRGHYDERGNEKDGDFLYSWSTEWYILQCKGCDLVFAQTVSTNSEDYSNFYEEDGSTGTVYHEKISYWPAQAKRERPTWLHCLELPANDSRALSRSIEELYKALDHDLNVLAGIGIRTTFDIASELLGVSPKLSFAQKLDGLVHSGRIGGADRGRLQRLVDAGSASAHRGWQPTSKDLDILMDVLEHFLHEAFITPAKKSRMDANLAKLKVPPRQ